MFFKTHLLLKILEKVKKNPYQLRVNKITTISKEHPNLSLINNPNLNPISKEKKGKFLIKLSMEQYSTNLRVRSERESLFLKVLQVILNSIGDSILFLASPLVSNRTVQN